MDEKELEKWKTAGKIAAECLEYGITLIKKDAKLLDVAEKIEAKIQELDAVPAFPVNISINDIAAHYTPSPNDEKKFGDDLVKLDVGVNYQGAIGDTAITVDLSGKDENAKLCEASKKALEEAIKMAKPGIEIGQIGKKVDETIRSFGFVPIRNLSGHGVGINKLHTGLTIPNFDTGEKTKLEKGQIVAIEPFATNGSGMIYEGHDAEIFMLVAKKPLRIGREILAEIEKFNGLPFTTRWLAKKHPLFKVTSALKIMNQQGMLRLYPVLPEQNHGLISQHEHTIIVDESPIVLTKNKFF